MQNYRSVLRMKNIRLEGKYESIAVADAVWCDENNPLL